MSRTQFGRWACVAMGTLLVGCADPVAQQPPTATPAAKVLAVQQAEKSPSLIESFADLARAAVVADAQPQALPEEAPLAALPAEPIPGLLSDEDEHGSAIVDFFGSDEWNAIKERNRQALLAAKRQMRLKKCNDIDVVVLVIDGLGYGDVGVYGQRMIKTPNIDLLAQTGIRFTNFYAGSSLQMPSHDSLMTGRHTGHTSLRGNRDTAALPKNQTTIAEMMYLAGFETAQIGSWELGDEQTSGTPMQQGFEQTYGYLNHTHADDYYPTYLYRNDERQSIPGNANNGRGNYSFDLVVAEAKEYLDRSHPRPFFLMLSLTPPRGNLDDVPSLEPYGSDDWPIEQKQYAAMIGRVDEAVGEIMDRAYARQSIRPMLILLTSSNGPRADGIDPSFFESNGPFEGVSGTLHEGGIRVPMIMWGPKLLTASGSVNHHPWAAWDVLPTLGELAGAMRVPTNIDGVSHAALTRGQLPPEPDPFYWELHEDGFVQAVRDGKWKAIRSGMGGPIKLFNLVDDPREETDLANSYPEVVKEMADYMATARRPSPDWPVDAE